MVVALFAMISKGVALFVFIEFLLVVCSPIIAVWQSGVFLCGLLSVVCGVFGALKQTKLLRFMGYTSVVNFGFILLGLGCMSFIGVASAILNFFVYTLTFFYFLVLLNQFRLVGDSVRTVEYLHQLRGLTRGSYYFLVCCLTVVFFSMAGFPPFAGFFGKYFLLVSLIEAGFGKVAFCLIFLNILGFFYYARLVNLLWFLADVKLVGGGGVFNLVKSRGVFVDVLFVVGFLFLVGFFCSLVGVVTGVSRFTQCLFIGL